MLWLPQSPGESLCGAGFSSSCVAIAPAPCLLWDTVTVCQVPGSLGETAALAGSQHTDSRMVPAGWLLGCLHRLRRGLWEVLAYWSTSVFAAEGSRSGGVGQRGEEGTWEPSSFGTQLLRSPH